MAAADRALEWLAPRLPERRWFAGKHRAVEGAAVLDVVPVTTDGLGLVVVARVAYRDGGDETYAIPSRAGPDGVAEAVAADPLWAALHDALRGGKALRGVAGALACHPMPEVEGMVPALESSRSLTDDQSNTSVVLAEEVVVKCYRRLEAGPHPEPELLAALAGFAHVPAYLGRIDYVPDNGAASVLCIAQAFVVGEPLGWEGMIERVAGGLSAVEGWALAEATDDAWELGAATGALHVALVEAFGLRTLDRGAASARLEAALRGVDLALAEMPGESSGALVGLVRTAPAALGPLAGDRVAVSRVHGDLHVAQFLRSAQGLLVVDFEGEPGRPLSARRADDSPLRDLASLLLSLDHVAAAAGRRVGGEARTLAEAWVDSARAAAIQGYATAVAASGLEVDGALLTALELEKECSEVLYAARYLPEWLYAPAQTMPRILARAIA